MRCAAFQYTTLRHSTVHSDATGGRIEGEQASGSCHFCTRTLGAADPDNRPQAVDPTCSSPAQFATLTWSNYRPTVFEAGAPGHCPLKSD